MELLTILIAMGLVQYWRGVAVLQNDAWLHQYFDRLNKNMRAPNQWLSILVVVGLPSILLLLLILWFDDLLLGLPRLALMVLVLVYSLGRGELTAQIAQYLAAWQNGDAQSAFRHLQGSQRVSPVQIDNPGGLHASARSTLFYRGFERLFAVLFWFIVAGPAAALLYRLLFAYRYELPLTDESSKNLAGKLLYWLEWLPVRGVGLTFGVMGNFVQGIQSWQSTLFNSAMGSAQVLNDNGLAALGLDMSCLAFDSRGTDSLQRQRFIDLAEMEIHSIQSLLSRCLVFWIVMMALMQLFF